jgi:hypothetical protein
MKRRLVALICLVILAPLLPFAVVSWIALGIFHGIDWLMDDRAFAKALVRASDKVERYFGVDPESLSRAARRRKDARACARRAGRFL